MKRTLKRMVALLMLVTMVFAMNITSFAEESITSDWMANISDKLKLSEISIPGTHDSATKYCTLNYCTSCQDMTMREQMENGYRYIDVRLVLNEEKDGFVFSHGSFRCKKGFWPWSEKITFNDFCDDLYDFLDKHPTETVIVCIKLENKEDDVATAEKLIMDKIAEKQDKWYTKNAIPRLQDVRGKAVLATRFEDVLGYGEDNVGLHFYWEDQGNTEPSEIAYEVSPINDKERLWVQDRFKYSTQDKINAIKDTIETATAGKDDFLINFLSVYGPSFLGHPKGNAETINKEFENIDLTSGNSHGVIVLDYATPELAKKIYNTNF